MKIAYISESILPSRTANSIHVMKMCQALAKKGHNLFLLAPFQSFKNLNHDDVYDYYGIENCFNIEFKRKPSIKKAGAIYYGFLSAVSAKRMSVDLVFGRSLFGCLASAILKLPVCFEIHRQPTTGIDKLLLKQLLRIKNFKMLVVISEPLKHYMADLYPSYKDKLYVLPDAADSIDNRDIVYEIASKNTGVLTAGYIGHLYEGRGVELIVELANKIKDIDFHLVGGLEEDIEKWKSKTGNINNLTFHGFVAPKDIASHLNSFNVLLAPYQKKVSVYGGGKTNTADFMSPLKIFEYMSAGKPILCSDLPVLREILEDGKTAIMLPPDQPTDWVKALLQLKEDKPYAARLGENAKRIFEKKYTWAARADKLISSFLER